MEASRTDSATALAELRRELEAMRKRHEEDLAHHTRALERLREENERPMQRVHREGREKTRQEDPTEDEGSRQVGRGEGRGEASQTILLNPFRRHPFTDELMAIELSAN